MFRRLLTAAMAAALAGCVVAPPPAPPPPHFVRPPPPPPPPPPPAPGPDLAQRLSLDQQRIAEGVRLRQLTPPEANELQGRYAAIERDRERGLAQGGGRFLPGQYEQLLSREDELSRRIFAYRHNGATPYAH